MEKTFKNCQSCGMPMKKSPNGGGKILDGTISTMYCDYCYGEGKFKQPEWTVGEMQEFVVAKMREMGFHRFLSKFFVKRIPRLERWKNKLE